MVKDFSEAENKTEWLIYFSFDVEEAVPNLAVVWSTCLIVKEESHSLKISYFLDCCLVPHTDISKILERRHRFVSLHELWTDIFFHEVNEIRLESTDDRWTLGSSIVQFHCLYLHQIVENLSESVSSTISALIWWVLIMNHKDGYLLLFISEMFKIVVLCLA